MNQALSPKELAGRWSAHQDRVLRLMRRGSIPFSGHETSRPLIPGPTIGWLEAKTLVPEMARATPHYVYVIGQEDDWQSFYANECSVMGSPIKIGISNNPDKRLAALQSAHPYDLRVWGTREYDTQADAQHIERELHREFDRHRLRGEWFALCDDIVEMILDSIDLDEPEVARLNV